MVLNYKQYKLLRIYLFVYLFTVIKLADLIYDVVATSSDVITLELLWKILQILGEGKGLNYSFSNIVKIVLLDQGWQSV